jgi:hypothetical protein
MMRWGDRHGVDSVVGLVQNTRLLALAGQEEMKTAAERFESTREKQRFFSSLNYAADPWDRSRRGIAKAVHGAQGIYNAIYCARGEMENPIKEQQLGLVADRTSCQGWWANQVRLLPSSAAYVLMETIRRVGLREAELARSQVSTIQLKILKIGMVIVRDTRRIRLFFSSAYPLPDLSRTLLTRLSSA